MLDFNIIIINRKNITEIVDLLIAKMVDAQNIFVHFILIN